MKIGSYLPSVILISIAMMFRGLRCWVDAGWKPDHPPKGSDNRSPKTIAWVKRTRPVLHVLATMLMTHLLGIVLFFTTKSSWFLDGQKVSFWVIWIIDGTHLCLVACTHCDAHHLRNSLHFIKDLLPTKPRCCPLLDCLEGVEPLLRIYRNLHHYITKFLFGCFTGGHTRASAFLCPSRQLQAPLRN